MSDIYIDNSWPDAYVDTVTVDETDEVTDVDASLNVNDIIQIGIGGVTQTYEISTVGTDTLTVDRNVHDTGVASLFYLPNMDGSETYPYPLIQMGLDEMDCVSSDVNIHIKHGEYVFDYTDQLPNQLDTSGEGDGLKNWTSKVEGYHTVLGDMRRAETYYQSPMNALINGIDASKIVTLDGSGLAYILEISGHDYLIFKNIHFTGCLNDAILCSSTPQYVLFDHCFFTDCRNIISGLNTQFEFRDCFIQDLTYTAANYTFNFTNTTVGHKIIGCVIDIGNRTNWGAIVTSGSTATIGGGMLIDNIIIGGLYPSLARPGDLVRGNIFYGSVNGYRFDMASSVRLAVTVQNNIFLGSIASDYGILMAGAGYVRNSHNCFWAASGEKLTYPVRHTDGGTIALGDGSIEADPLFADAANGDFRLLPESPCHNMGLANLYEGYDSIGPVNRKSMLGEIANARN